MCTTRNTRKTHGEWIPNNTPHFNTLHPAISEKWKRCAHVHTCYNPPMICVKRRASGPLFTHRFSAQSSSCPRDTEKGTKHVRASGCTLVDVPGCSLDLCKTPSEWASNHTPNFIKVQLFPKNDKGTCACAHVQMHSTGPPVT